MASLQVVLDNARSSSASPQQAVSNLAEAIANRHGATLVGSGLRLVEDTPPQPIGCEVDNDASTPFVLGRLYELLLAPSVRRRSGAHLTPATIARKLVGCLPDVWVAGDRPARVLDPAVGGGAFLIAAAEHMTAAGADPSELLDQLGGYDIDPGAVAVAEAALGIWALENGVAPRELNSLRVGDGLLVELPQSDVVVGNPPFLNQLRKTSANTTSRRGALRERWGDLVGAYTDDAWLFLAAGIDALSPHGGLAMVQPLSILAAKHATAARAHVQNVATLSGLWVANGHVFDAVVQVCGVLAHRPAEAAEPEHEADAETTGTPVKRWTGPGFVPLQSSTGQPDPTSWGPLGAQGRGIPSVRFQTREVLADLATVTAGFRDQFYGFAPYVVDRSHGDCSDMRQLITSGMIDPFRLRWGHDDFRFAKKLYRRPTLGVGELTTDNPVLGEWVTARRRPKVLVATQTRVIEAWVDTSGETVPATPVISVEPNRGHDLWLIAAALSSPAVTAYFLAQKFGTALSLDALKLAARDVCATPLPTDRRSWEEGAKICQALNDAPPEGSGVERLEMLRLFGEAMAAAYDVDPTETVDWWLDRLPKRPEER